MRSHRGRSPQNPTWALTFASTSSVPSKGYTQIVQSRSSENLKSIILDVVRPGSIIVTDEWRAYNALSCNPNFCHQKITHKYHSGLRTGSMKPVFSGILKNRTIS